MVYNAEVVMDNNTQYHITPPDFNLTNTAVSVPYVVFVVSFLQDGGTPLWESARKGRSEVVSLLLERGAGKEARDTKVSTPCS